MRKVIELLMSALRMLFPKSRLANAVYLVLGFVLASWEPLAGLYHSVVELF